MGIWEGCPTYCNSFSNFALKKGHHNLEKKETISRQRGTYFGPNFGK